MVLQDLQPIAAIATTPAAARCLLGLVRSRAGITLWLPQTLQSQITETDLAGGTIGFYEGSLRKHVGKIWSQYRSFVFGLATGAVVRLIAPLLQDKAIDPAIVVVDESGQFVISLCGGHQAGADQLTRFLAHTLGATPVLTGSANNADLPGIDVIGQPFGWQKGTGDWTGVSAAIARGDRVQVLQDSGCDLWAGSLPENHPFVWGEPEYSAETQPDFSAQARVWISYRQRQFAPKSDFPKVQWHPRVLWVGIGCERGTPRSVIEAGIQKVLQANHLAEGAIAGLATIDLKADEGGLMELATDRSYPLQCFTAEQLQRVEVPTPSDIVAAEVGTPSVAEAAALLAAQTTDLANLLVKKQIFRQEGQPGAVTIAIAVADREYTGRLGTLWLVGTGPGNLDQITPAAKGAISQADVVIGYSLYIDLIRPLLRPGQIVEASPITQERQRAERAIELANWGLTVAIISSGDCGIYAMGGLVLEVLQGQGWDGVTPELQVFPGISALQAAASRVGAPLMHDFCAISLSNLLTPWDVIEKRLTAAAQADFVTAFYNPKSQTRTEQIEIAQRVFLKFRSPETPVALVRSVYRPDEEIRITTLAQMLDAPIDMLTTVIIGNQSTRFYQGWVITPRGYLGFQ
ncbi:precorrin-3B C(17)-methyltransferase [Alkalinema pantanalense CENA528]|uniref:precorrin-3B C(17)-methyltransferase n=1 Tax=Alkalinema pantanalense TaxID=1620705 RepID=UPI003D6DC815